MCVTAYVCEVKDYCVTNDAISFECSKKPHVLNVDNTLYLPCMVYGALAIKHQLYTHTEKQNNYSNPCACMLRVNKVVDYSQCDFSVPDFFTTMSWWQTLINVRILEFRILN